MAGVAGGSGTRYDSELSQIEGLTESIQEWTYVVVVFACSPR